MWPTKTCIQRAAGGSSRYVSTATSWIFKIKQKKNASQVYLYAPKHTYHCSSPALDAEAGITQYVYTLAVPHTWEQSNVGGDVCNW